MKRKSLLFHILAGLVVTLLCCCQAQDAEWKDLFDGRSLNGWMVKCRQQDEDKQYWKVDNGAITAEVPQGSNHHYIWLLTEVECGNFELKLRVRSYANSTGNSGVRSTTNSKPKRIRKVQPL